MRAATDMLILASSSPRRRALLRAAGVEFRAIAPRAEEIPSTASARYAHLVRQAALRKAGEVARRHAGPVLGADTIVVCAGEIMGKPRDEADARRMLRKLSGRWHSVYTGVALVQGRGCLSQAGDPTGSPVSRKSAAPTLLATRSRLRREWVRSERRWPFAGYRRMRSSGIWQPESRWVRPVPMPSRAAARRWFARCAVATPT